MPRKPRYYLPDVPVHIVQRGHSREPIFFEAQDYATYAYWLGEGAQKYDVAIHAFVFMTNHIHLLVTPEDGIQISRLMQFIGRRYVPYLNHKYGRSGSAWEGRYKASLVQDEAYLFTVMRYIELNPVRAAMVVRPGQYRWSSFCHNAGVREISFLRFHSLYEKLGKTREDRHRAYCYMFEGTMDEADIKLIRESWQSGTPLGNDWFKERVQQRLQCKVGYARRGRPAKNRVKGL